jgi:Spore coat assembly protein
MKNIFKTLILTLILLAVTTSLSCASNSGSDNESNSETSAETVAKVTQYLPETPENATLPNDGVYIIYAVNSSDAGKISGEAKQDAAEGKKTSKVTATANLGYKFVKWSDGSTDASRSDDTASASEVITAIFDYDILELPVVLINTETGKDVQSKTEYIGAGISMFNGGDTAVTWNAEIRGRGNNTWSYAKKSYKVKFAEKQQPFGLGSGDNRVWVLLANQCDQSLLRNHFAFELAKSFDKIEFAPSSTSVEVYLNGEYRGVYLLAEEIKVGSSRVDVDDNTDEVDTGYLVELSAYAAGDWIFNVGSRQYQVRSDLSTDQATATKQYQFISDYMNKCWDAVNSGNREEIEKLIDIDAYVDTYLVEEITKNLDLGWDSYYLHKDKGGKLVLGPMWDFDLSFGNSNEGCQYYTDIYAGVDSRNGLGNPWYTQASKLDWFRELVVQRWDKVYDSIVSKLPAQILAEGQRGYNSYCRNFLKWQIFGTVQNRETELITSLKNYKEHYEYFSEWVKNRIEWLDNYYHTDEYKNGDFIKADNNQGGGGGWWGGGGGAPADDVYGNDETKTIMKTYTPFDGKLTLDSADSPGYDNENPDNLFDSDASTKYCYQLDNGYENDIVFTASKAFTVKAYVLRTANDTEAYTDRNPDKWVLYGRNSENEDWVVIDSVDDGENQLDAVNYTCFGFTVDNPISYKYYRLWIKNDGTMQLSDLILFG